MIEILAELQRRFLFNRPVYENAELEECLVLSEPFGLERLLLVSPHIWGVLARFVGSYYHVARLGKVVLCGYPERKLAVPDYPEVQLQMGLSRSTTNLICCSVN